MASLKFSPISSPKPRRKAQNIPLVCSNLAPNLQRGGGMPQFCLVFYAILQSWQPKGGHGIMAPLPKYAPATDTLRRGSAMTILVFILSMLRLFFFLKSSNLEPHPTGVPHLQTTVSTHQSRQFLLQNYLQNCKF